MTPRSNYSRWRDHDVQVVAEFIPRYLWTTASIDIYVDDHRLIRTGGVWKIRGAAKAEFEDNNTSHIVELSWQSPSRGIDFLYQLSIDGQQVQNSTVRPSNWKIFAPIGVLVICTVGIGCIAAIGVAIHLLTGRG